MATPNIIVISELDHVTVNGLPVGSFVDSIANKNATASEAHAALAAFVAGLQSQISTQTAAASAAIAALATLHGQVDTFVQAAIAAGSDVTKLLAIVAEVAPLDSAARLAAKQIEVSKLQAALAAAQAAVANHT